MEVEEIGFYRFHDGNHDGADYRKLLNNFIYTWYAREGIYDVWLKEDLIK